MDYSAGTITAERDAVHDSVGSSENRAAVAPPRTSTTVMPWAFPVTVDRSRDALLTDFGRETLKDRYLLPGESYQDLFARVAAAYADDAPHAQRLYDYISKLWFMPSTPVLSNGGTGRGLPISCYLNSVGDSLEAIVGTWERERLACGARRRYRHLLGPCPRHWRARRIERQDQRHHPVRARHGLADAGDQPGFATAWLGGGVSRHQPPRDRGILRDSKAFGRLQQEGTEPPPWRPCHRQVHGSRGARATNGTSSAPRPASAAPPSTRAGCSPSSSRRGWRRANPISSSSTM